MSERYTVRSPRAWVLSVMAVVVLLWAVAHAPFAQAPSSLHPQDVGLSPARLARLTETLHAYVEEGRLPGGVMLVARRGEVAYLEAFGLRDRESRAPMREDSLFRIASQTKAIVSTMILMLQEDGRLLITDPVGKYLPEFAKTTVAVARSGGGYDVVAARRPVTLRDLLTHTSGVGYGGGAGAERWEAAGITGWYFADRDEPIADTVSRMASLPFEAQPGERWVYGYSIDILGAVAEKASGQPLDQLLAARIFQPLGMTDTQFYVPESKADRLVTVYSAGPSGLTRTPDEGGMQSQGAYVAGPRTSFSGGAGLVSTARDYGRFLQMLLNGGALDGTRLLSRNTVALMTTDHLPEGVAFRPGQGFGLGFSVVTDVGARGTPGSVGEYGWGGAYHSTYWVDPVEEMVVVYLTQVIPAGDLDDHDRIRAMVYAALE